MLIDACIIIVLWRRDVFEQPITGGFCIPDHDPSTINDIGLRQVEFADLAQIILLIKWASLKCVSAGKQPFSGHCESRGGLPICVNQWRQVCNLPFDRQAYSLRPIQIWLWPSIVFNRSRQLDGNFRQVTQGINEVDLDAGGGQNCHVVFNLPISATCIGGDPYSSDQRAYRTNGADPGRPIAGAVGWCRHYWECARNYVMKCVEHYAAKYGKYEPFEKSGVHADPCKNGILA